MFSNPSIFHQNFRNILLADKRVSERHSLSLRDTLLPNSRLGRLEVGTAFYEKNISYCNSRHFFSKAPTENIRISLHVPNIFSRKATANSLLLLSYLEFI